MYRENLSVHPIGEQLSMDTEYKRSALTPESLLAWGKVSRTNSLVPFGIYDERKYDRAGFLEFLRMFAQLRKEFRDAQDLKETFRIKGAQPLPGNIMLLYLEDPSLCCNYSLQYNLEQSEPFYVQLVAYLKEPVKHRHHH